MRKSSDRSPPVHDGEAPADNGRGHSGVRDGGAASRRHDRLGDGGVGGRARADRRRRRHRRSARAAAAALQGPAAGAPGTVILKIPSQFPENRAVGDHFNFYEREGRFYQQLGDKLPMRTPQLLLEPHRPGRRQLRAAARGPRRAHDDQPDRGGHRRAGRQALQALARLHGAWWTSPTLDSLDWMPRLDDPINLAAGQRTATHGPCS